MRLLVLSYEYPPLGGGGGVALAHSAQYWVRQGNQVTIITSGVEGLPAYEQQGLLTIYRLPVFARNARATASLASLLSFPLVALRFVLNRWQSSAFDCILSSFAIPSGVAGIQLAKQWQLPHVVWVMGGDAYDPSKVLSPHRIPLLKQTVATVLGQAQVIITMSQDMVARVQQIYAPATPIHVAPQGLALAPYIREPRTSSCFTMVSVARLVRRKRFEHLIQAFALLPPDAARLWIIGDGPEQPRLEAFIAHYGLHAQVQLLGYLAEDEKLARLRQADCFVLVSEHEGFGLVYLEAAAQGLPIVAGMVGGQTDFLRHGETGWLVPHDQPHLLAQALLFLMTQPAVRLWMGQNARCMAQQYQIDRVADRFLQVLYDLTNSN